MGVVAQDDICAQLGEPGVPAVLEGARLVAELGAHVGQDHDQVRFGGTGFGKVVFDLLHQCVIVAVLALGHDRGEPGGVGADFFDGIVIDEGQVGKDGDLHALHFHDQQFILFGLIPVGAGVLKTDLIQHIQGAHGALHVHIQQVVVAGAHQIDAGVLHGLGEFIGEVQVDGNAITEIAGAVALFAAGGGAFVDADGQIRLLQIGSGIFKDAAEIVGAGVFVVCAGDLILQQQQVANIGQLDGVGQFSFLRGGEMNAVGDLRVTGVGAGRRLGGFRNEELVDDPLCGFLQTGPAVDAHQNDEDQNDQHLQPIAALAAGVGDFVRGLFEKIGHEDVELVHAENRAGDQRGDQGIDQIPAVIIAEGEELEVVHDGDEPVDQIDQQGIFADLAEQGDLPVGDHQQHGQDGCNGDTHHHHAMDDGGGAGIAAHQDGAAVEIEPDHEPEAQGGHGHDGDEPQRHAHGFAVCKEVLQLLLIDQIACGEEGEEGDGTADGQLRGEAVAEAHEEGDQNGPRDQTLDFFKVTDGGPPDDQRQDIPVGIIGLREVKADSTVIFDKEHHRRVEDQIVQQQLDHGSPAAGPLGAAEIAGAENEGRHMETVNKCIQVGSQTARYIEGVRVNEMSENH